jgi:transposase-like protein
MSKKISLAIKDKIISKIKDEGLSVAQAASEFGLSANTIYGWVSPARNSKADPSIMELSRLRRENAELKQIIGGLTLDTERGKKNR